MRKLGGQVAAGAKEIHDDHFIIVFQKHDEVLTCAGEPELFFDTINQNCAALMLGGAFGDLLATLDEVFFVSVSLTWTKRLQSPNGDIGEVLFRLLG